MYDYPAKKSVAQQHKRANSFGCVKKSLNGEKT